MNPWLSCALADARGREMRGEPACPRGRPAPGEAARSLVRESRPEAARSLVRESRPEAAWSRIGAPGTGARPDRGARRSRRVRHRIGFTLVEAGLHLLATASRN
jgi:hypothetical protein